MLFHNQVWFTLGPQRFNRVAKYMPKKSLSQVFTNNFSLILIPLVALYKKKYDVAIADLIAVVTSTIHHQDEKSYPKMILDHMGGALALLAHARLFWTNKFNSKGLWTTLFLAASTGYMYTKSSEKWYQIPFQKLAAQQYQKYHFIFHLLVSSTAIAQLLSIKK